MKQRNGFTLIELIVVIAIVAALLAVLSPALGRGRARAHAAVCQGNLRQMWLGIVLYAGDWRERVPYVVEPLNGEDPLTFSNSFVNVMCPAYLTRPIFVCPAAVNGYPGADRRGWRMTYAVLGANALGYEWPWDASKADYDENGLDADGNYNFGVYTPLDGRPLHHLHTVFLRPIVRDLAHATNINFFPHPYRVTRPGTGQAGRTVGYALHAFKGGDIHIEEETKYWSSLKPN